MITRIKIDGFKSFLGEEIFLGPFTCMVGPNAAGKSNFFDALMFLSKLADNTIIEAARSIRSEHKKHSDISDIFYNNGGRSVDEISFEIDMIVPQFAEDDLGQKAEASITSLHYCLVLKKNNDIDNNVIIQILKEELSPNTLGSTKKNIHFERSEEWIKSVLKGRRSTRNPFISTQDGIIKLHSDSKEKKRGGRTTEFLAEKMPRTLLSTATSESPTAFLARHEMRNWMMLQFEPSALRQPNFIYETKNAAIKANGLNLPATIYRLHQENKEKDIYQHITNSLKELVKNVNEIKIDRDDKRDLLTLLIRFKDGLTLPAQSLSDGTLRFLGLSILKTDNQNRGVICLEEPENGISPKKIDMMVALLKEIATDTEFEIDMDNPLRQVIINTHSPIVVNNVPADSLYFINEREKFAEYFGRKVAYSGFSALPKTWKTLSTSTSIMSLGEILSYLEQNEMIEENVMEPKETYKPNSKSKTVREYTKQLTFVFGE